MKLRWRKTIDGYKAGPFTIKPLAAAYTAYIEDFELECLVLSLDEAKAACQRLYDTVREIK